jgi:hypothetical protein
MATRNSKAAPKDQPARNTIDTYQSAADVTGLLAAASGLLTDAICSNDPGRYVVGAQALVDRARALASQVETALLARTVDGA